MDDARNASAAAATSQSQSDARLVAAVQAYMADVDAGRRPNRQEFVARHPDIADELSACLQGMAFVKSAAAEFDDDDQNGAGGAARTNAARATSDCSAGSRWATSGSCARSAAAAWASSTRRCSSRSAGASR